MSECWASRSFKRSVNPRPSLGGFPKWGYPKKDGLQWKILFKLMIWEYPHFRKPPHWLMEMQKHCQTAGTWKRASFQKVSSGANTWGIMHSIVRAKLLDSLARIAVLEDERWWIQRTKGKHQQSKSLHYREWSKKLYSQSTKKYENVSEICLLFSYLFLSSIKRSFFENQLVKKNDSLT